MRFIWFLICVLAGLGLLFAGLLVPVHLRAVDVRVLQQAGRGSPSLVEEGIRLASESKLGPAQLVLQVAKQERLPGTDKLQYAVDNLARQHGRWQVWGGPEPRFESIFEPDKRLPDSASEPFTQYVIREPNRQRVLTQLASSPEHTIQALLQIRGYTNTVLFPPSQSTSGQALDAAISIAGLLIEGNHVKASFSDDISRMADQAGGPGRTLRLEQALLDLASLGQRLNWGQLVAFVGQVPDAETLRLLMTLVRQNEPKLPLLFSSVILSGKPAAITQYLMTFSKSGWKDLEVSTHQGAGAVNELLRRSQGIYFSHWNQTLGLSLAYESPWAAMALKWLLYLGAGFLFASALHFGRHAVAELEIPLQVRGFHIARELLFGLGFLVAVLLLTEPYLSQESQRVSFPFQLRLPTVGRLVPAVAGDVHSKLSIMNQQLSLLTLLLFFILQGLLYTACVVKLAEIRRQKVVPRIKLRLLDNEDHLFDAGLYLGFVGTIISLILVSLGVIKPSLMAAYSSTSFGIIFVSFFKIFHLRPARRKLLLEAEAQGDLAAAPGATPRLVTP